MSNPLKLLRLVKGLSQAEVATKLNISQSLYSRLERGVIPIPPEFYGLLQVELGFAPPDPAGDFPLNQNQLTAAHLYQDIFYNYKMQIYYLTEENERLRDQVKGMLSVLQ